MTKKTLISIGMALFLLIAQFGTVLAAQEPTPITGTVKTVTLEPDPTTNETIVVVEVVVDATTGATQTVRLSAQTAEDLGLVTIDPVTKVVTLNDIPEDMVVVIDPTTVLTDSPTTEEAQHPVGSKLADFFGELLGVDYETIMDNHDDGVGFGVIAQALWMTERLDGDTATFQMIIDAKKSGDYSELTLPDGSTPQNWGQFKKALLDKHDNLGTIMSDHGQQDSTDITSQSQRDKHKDKNKDKHNNRHKP